MSALSCDVCRDMTMPNSDRSLCVCLPGTFFDARVQRCAGDSAVSSLLTFVAACKPGFFSHSGRSSCSACSPGRFSNHLSQNATGYCECKALDWLFASQHSQSVLLASSLLRPQRVRALIVRQAGRRRLSGEHLALVRVPTGHLS